MVIECKARRADCLQHRIAQRLAVVEFTGVSGFEEKPTQLEELHEETIAGLDRIIVDMAPIGKVNPGRLFARDDLQIACQGR